MPRARGSCRGRRRPPLLRSPSVWDAAPSEEASRVVREAAADSAGESSRLAGIRSELDREKEEITSWVQRRTKDLEVKESQILERSRTIEERVAEVLAKEREAVAKV